MREKMRIIAVFAITFMVILLTLTVPVWLLRYEENQVLGKSIQADQLYYADNVSSGEGQKLDLKTRLMMKEGQWKTEKTQILPLDVYEGDFILSEDSMLIYACDLFKFLQSDMWLDDCVLIDDVKLYNDMTYSYIYHMTDGDDSGIGSSFSQRLETSAEKNSELTLYRYDDCVFNSYYFYVWEYSFKDDKKGIEVYIEADAVTLELYCVRVHGEIFDQLPWEYVMGITMQNRYSEFIYSNYRGDGWESLPASCEALIPAYICSYWMSLLYTEPFLNTIPDIDLADEKLETKEIGYNFSEGNFIVSQLCRFYMGDYPYWIRIEGDGGNYVYCHTSFDDGGVDWYMVPEPDKVSYY